MRTDGRTRHGGLAALRLQREIRWLLQLSADVEKARVNSEQVTTSIVMIDRRYLMCGQGGQQWRVVDSVESVLVFQSGDFPRTSEQRRGCGSAACERNGPYPVAIAMMASTSAVS